ncbi:hypothetical protein EDC52_1038 [Biostraticola tofi]|uniref:Uncharacterized protein n=1 Tax=Biostraticola tofi TaxID=466109 RepID=A0A4R3Z244_9GAMM|nr:hypothetical protein EDC52_1038 [Biostraticola tofi]
MEIAIKKTAIGGSIKSINSDMVFAIRQSLVNNQITLSTVAKGTEDKGMIQLCNDYVTQSNCALIFFDSPVHRCFHIRNAQWEKHNRILIFTSNTRSFQEFCSINVIVLGTTYRRLHHGIVRMNNNAIVQAGVFRRNRSPKTYTTGMTVGVLS